jgi:N-acetylglucosamine-6-sulfatase
MYRLAKEGVQFENSFVTTSLCSPSRASFLTGKYARCHGVKNNATPWVESNVTFLEMLREKGYEVGFIGKWHMPGKGIPDLVSQGKADRMVSFSYLTGQGRYFDCPLIVNGEKVKRSGYITDVLTDYALEFMDKRRSRPFCLFLSHKAVHALFKPPARYKGVLKDAPLSELEENETDLPQGLTNSFQIWDFKDNQQGYYEALMAVDESVGRVLKALDDRGIAENTLVIYTGDNGYFWGEHGLIDKRYAYEESIRIPLLMRYPRLIPEGGRKVSEMVLNIDLAPTLLSAAGIEKPEFMQGHSYLGLAAGKKILWRDSFLYEYYMDPIQVPGIVRLQDNPESLLMKQVNKIGFPHPPIRAVRTRDWKYIRYLAGDLKDEMYNLDYDPKERNNLVDDTEAAGKKKELVQGLDRLEKETSC